MKLKFYDLQELETPIVTHSMSVKQDGYNYARFVIKATTEQIPAETTLTGQIDFMSDDDMVLNTLTVEEFLRYERYDDPNAGTIAFYFTQDPVPEPAPEPEPPTPEEILAEAKRGKDNMIISSRDTAIKSGIDVETSYGTEHFVLSEKDQTLLLGIYSMVQQGVTAYPYHSVNLESRSTNMCTIYSDEDIAKIAVAAFGHITYHETYANLMLQWLDRETDPEVVREMQYGTKLPEDLKSYMEMVLSAASSEAKPAILIEDGNKTADSQTGPV